MSMVFRFRMLSDESDYFVREYEVKYDMNLAEFNDFICDDLHFDKGGVTSFFISNGIWEKGREFTREDMGNEDREADKDGDPPLPMESVLLGQVIRENRDRLIFLFDIFGDRALYLEMTEAKTGEDGVKYPRITMSKAAPPNQYKAEGSLLFDDIMSDFQDFDDYDESGGEYSDDDY